MKNSLLTSVFTYRQHMIENWHLDKSQSSFNRVFRKLEKNLSASKNDF